MKNVVKGTETEEDIYRKLQQHLNECAVGFPATESGNELKILKHLFSPEEAQIALNLNPGLPEKLNKIFRRFKEIGITKEQLEKKLDEMVEKGIVFGGEIYKMLGPGKYYSNMEYIVGLYEFSVNKLNEDYINLSNEYKTSDEYLAEFFNPKTPFQFRTIPVEKSISNKQLISNYDDIYHLVETSEGPFAVLECICKKSNDIIGEKCKKTDLRETCISLNEGALASLQAGISRKINKEELFQILARAQEEGLVFTPANMQKPTFVCTCCGDCCGVLKSLKKMPIPSDYIISNYYAKINDETCEGCETCIDQCHMEALSILDGISQVNLDRCIGCGNCVTKCPSNSIQLIKKDKEIIPPKDLMDLYTQILMKKLR